MCPNNYFPKTSIGCHSKNGRLRQVERVPRLVQKHADIVSKGKANLVCKIQRRLYNVNTLASYRYAPKG